MVIYDIKSLEEIDSKLKILLSKKITTLSFSEIDYEELSRNFQKLRESFPKVKVKKYYKKTDLDLTLHVVDSLFAKLKINFIIGLRV